MNTTASHLMCKMELGKAVAPPGGCDDEQVANSVVDSLPDELLRNIFWRLPLWTLAQARSVCGEWNRIALSNCHGEEQKKQLAQQAWCLLAMSHRSGECSEAKCLAFDPCSQRWFKLLLPPMENPTELVLSAVGKSGLVTIGTRQQAAAEGVERYWTGNPLTGRWQKLPDCQAVDASMGEAIKHEVIFSPASMSYRIVHFRSIYQAARHQPAVHLLGPFSWATYVYDSGGKEWRQGAAIRRTRPIDRETFSSCVSKGVVFFSQAYFRAGFVEIEIFAYDAEQNRFSVVVPAAAFLLSARTLLSPDQIQAYVDDDEDRGVKLLALITVWEVDMQGANSHSCHLASLSFHGDLLRWVVDWQTIVPCSEATTLICFASGSGGQFVYLTSRTPSCRVLIYDRFARQWISTPLLRPTLPVRWISSSTSTHFTPGLDVDSLLHRMHNCR